MKLTTFALLITVAAAQRCTTFPSEMCIRANAWNVYWPGTDADDIERDIRTAYDQLSTDYMRDHSDANDDRCFLIIRDVVCASQIPRCYVTNDTNGFVLKRDICKDLCLAYQKCFGLSTTADQHRTWKTTTPTTDCLLWTAASDDRYTCSGRYVDWPESSSASQINTFVVAAAVAILVVHQ